VAALLVLGGLALGRDAITLRLVAAGALLILLLWPEALIGPSFQMSFAAIIAIVALGEHPRFRAFAAARDEVALARLLRHLGVMLLTGFAVELVLAPIALFHFHKAGLLGAFANLIAIPLTTFVVMPLEALALLLDLVGLGAPFWWLMAKTLDLLLLIAHTVAASPWATMASPSLSAEAFGATILGGLWCLLWRSRWRWAGLVPVLAGVAVVATAPLPDVLITGDGRHVAVRSADGRMAMLRAGAGSYVRDMMAESAGEESISTAVADLPEARCSLDLCAVNLTRADRQWRLLIARSRDLVERDVLERDCASADIVIADRRLPFWGRPRWIKADRRLLAATGGLAISLEDRAVKKTRGRGDAHPWVVNPPPRRTRNSVVASQ
jgi:competence protein ComEC